MDPDREGAAVKIGEVAKVERISYGKKEITPLSTTRVKEIMDGEYNMVLGFEGFEYTTTRGVRQLLERELGDYAELPDSEGETAKKIFKSLRRGASWLDVGCGSGTFIMEVLSKINSNITPVGFDARTWKRGEQIPEAVYGNIDNLSSDLFAENEDGFDLITCASVLYHIPDHWGVIKKITGLLKEGGIFLGSTMVRPVGSYDTPYDDENGEFVGGWVKESGATYYRNRNLFDPNGNLMSMAELLKVIREDNPNFVIEYHALEHKGAMQGRTDYGGQISIKKKGSEKLNLSKMFYCYIRPDNPSSSGLLDVSYIVARSDSEANKLREKGYVSIEDRM